MAQRVNTAEWPQLGDDGYLRPLETLLLKFMWVCSEHLDGVDFINTAILIRSLSVGKRMTRTLVCDILAEFTRFFRYGPTDNSDTCNKSVKNYTESLESWLEFDLPKNTGHIQGNAHKPYLKQSDIEECKDNVKESNKIPSYANPFDCHMDIACLLQKLTSDIAPETPTCRLGGDTTSTPGAVNQNLLLTVVNASKTLEEFTQCYSHFLHALDCPNSQASTTMIKSTTNKVSNNKGVTNGKISKSSHSAEHQTKTVFPGVNSAWCMPKQTEALKSLNSKTPEKNGNCSGKVSFEETSPGSEKADAVLTEFFNLAKLFSWLWESGDIGGSVVDSSLGETENCANSNSTNIQQKSSDYAESSMILEEISMDISDSFEDWFADSRNLACSQLLPSSDDPVIQTSTPLSSETLPTGETSSNVEVNVTLLWPKLPTVSQNTRRRLWDDNVLGNGDSTLGIDPLDNTTKFDTKAQSHIQKNREDREVPGLREGPDQFLPCYSMPTKKQQSIHDIPPISRPPPKVIRQFKIPTIQNQKKGGYRPTHMVQNLTKPQPQNWQSPYSQATQKPKDVEEANVENTWAHVTLNDFLPHQMPSKCITTVTHSYNSTQSHIPPPYRLWADAKTNPVQYSQPLDNSFHLPSAVPDTPQFYPQMHSDMQSKRVLKPPMVQNENITNLWSGTSQRATTQPHSLFNADIASHQEPLHQQVLRPPPGIHLPGGAHLQPGVQHQNTYPQAQNQQQQQRQHQMNHPYNPFIPPARSECDLVYQQSMQKKPEMNIGHKDQLFGRPFDPYTSQAMHQAFQTTQQPYVQQQHLPEQQLKAPPPNQPVHAQYRSGDVSSVAKFPPPWRLTTYVYSRNQSTDSDIQAPSSQRNLPEETPYNHGSEQLLGQDGSGSGFSNYHEDQWGFQRNMSNSHTGINNNLTASHDSKTIPRHSLTTCTANNLAEWPTLSSMYSTDGKKDQGIDMWRQQEQRRQQQQQLYQQQMQHQKQVEQKQQQQPKQYQDQPHLYPYQQQQRSVRWTVPPPSYTQGSLVNTQPPCAQIQSSYGSDFRAMVQALTLIPSGNKANGSQQSQSQVSWRRPPVPALALSS